MKKIKEGRLKRKKTVIKMSAILQQPWGMVFLLLLTIAVILGKGKKLLAIFDISKQTFSLLVFLLLGGSLLSAWNIQEKSIYLNYGSLFIPLILLILWFIQIDKKQKFRAFSALLVIALYYVLYQGGYIWKAEQYLPQISYLFAPLLAMIAYLFCRFSKGTFIALSGGVILGDTVTTVLIGGPVFQEIFGLESVNLLLFTLFICAFYNFLLSLIKHLKGINRYDSLTNPYQ